MAANVILSIGSKLGPGGLASLQAGIQMIGQMAARVAETIKELDKFSLVLQTVDMNMVNYADSAAKGQIDTFSLMKMMQKLTASGMKPTKEEFKTLAVMATNMAQATGQDATAAFERLTESLSKGSTRALREYGIELQESGTLQDKQRDALKKLTEGNENLTVEVTTLTQRLYGLNNAMSTAFGVTWDAATTKGSALSTIIDELTEYTNAYVTSLTTLTASERDYVFSLTGIADAFSMIVAQVKDAIWSMDGFVELYQKVAAAFGGAQATFDMKKYTPGQFLLEEQQRIADRMEARNVNIEQEDAARKARLGEIASNTAGMAGGMRGSGGGWLKEINATLQAYWEEYNKDSQEIRSFVEEKLQTNTAGIALDIEGATYDPFSGREKKREYTNTESGSSQLRQLEYAHEIKGLQADLVNLKDEELHLMEMANTEYDARLKLVEDEEYKEATLYTMYQERQLAYKEERLAMEIERELDLDFASEFAMEWDRSLMHISQGAMTARGAFGLMAATYEAAALNITKGSKRIGVAILEAIEVKARGMAIEEGMAGIADTLAAVSAFARREFAKGTALLGSAAGHYAYAALWGTGAYLSGRVADKVGGGAGSSAGGVASAASTMESTRTGYYRETYDQNQFGGGSTVTLVLDDSAAMFKLVQNENSRAQRRGERVFQEVA